jgi:heme-degrading monooxygenase HmoA
MIARVWTAQSSRAGSRAYGEHFHTEVLPALATLPGYEGALLLNEPAGDTTTITVMTFWKTRKAIEAFAGADITRAVVTDEAARLLRTHDRTVRHLEVVKADRLHQGHS